MNMITICARFSGQCTFVNLIGMELRMATSTRLKTCLYSFTSPGGPMYPTRVVRHAAWDALDLLFPVSKSHPITIICVKIAANLGHGFTFLSNVLKVKT